MCVIIIAERKRIPERYIEQSMRTNRDGAGVAWRDGRAVVWKKGMRDPDEVVELTERIPLPYIFHARISTVGSGDNPELTHPFPLNLATGTEGRSRRGVLFHNGHWSQWENAFWSAVGQLKRIPPGAWSDSRVMAMVKRIWGNSANPMLERSRDRIVVLTPSEIEILNPTLWEKFEDWVISNRTCIPPTPSIATSTNNWSHWHREWPAVGVSEEQRKYMAINNMLTSIGNGDPEWTGYLTEWMY